MLVQNHGDNCDFYNIYLQILGLFTCYAHFRYEDIGRAETGKTGGNTTLELVAESGNVLDKLEEIARHGEVLNSLAFLTAAYHKACALE